MSGHVVGLTGRDLPQMILERALSMELTIALPFYLSSIGKESPKWSAIPGSPFAMGRSGRGRKTRRSTSSQGRAGRAVSIQALLVRCGGVAYAVRQQQKVGGLCAVSDGDNEARTGELRGVVSIGGQVLEGIVAHIVEQQLVECEEILSVMAAHEDHLVAQHRASAMVGILRQREALAKVFALIIGVVEAWEQLDLDGRVWL